MIGDFYWTKLDNILAIFSHVECHIQNISNFVLWFVFVARCAVAMLPCSQRAAAAAEVAFPPSCRVRVRRQAGRRSRRSATVALLLATLLPRCHSRAAAGYAAAALPTPLPLPPLPSIPSSSKSLSSSPIPMPLLILVYC